MANNKDLIKLSSPKSELIKSVSVKSLDRLEQDIETAIAKAEPPQRIKGPLTGMEFALIPSGSFLMGSNDGGCNEMPVHKVTLKSFYMMTTVVTQAQWKELIGNNPSYNKGDSLPVEQVSWYDVQEFLKKLNVIDPGRDYRLPSESEWEYACRAGTTTKYYSGDNESDLARIGWYDCNETDPVGQKIPNAWGLYDMSGNVMEWCQDWYHDSYSGAPSDGSEWDYPNGLYRLLRGGAWSVYPSHCRSAVRGSGNPDHRSINYGFRLVRSL